MKSNKNIIGNWFDFTHDEHMERFIRFLVIGLVCSALISLIIITITSFRFFAPPTNWAIGFKLDGQTLASYVAITIGTAVSLAGSLVAITLASAAMKASEAANGLQETANLLQKEANDPLTQRSNDVLLARNRLESSIGLIRHAYIQIGKLAHASSTGMPKFDFFKKIVGLLKPTISSALLETDLVTCCVAASQQQITNKTQDEIFAAVTEILKVINAWEIDLESTEKFVTDFKFFKAHFEMILGITEEISKKAKDKQMLERNFVSELLKGQ